MSSNKVELQPKDTEQDGPVVNAKPLPRGFDSDTDGEEGSRAEPATAEDADDAQEEAEGGASSSESDADYAEVLARLKDFLSLGGGQPPLRPRKPLLSSFDLSGVAELIKSGKARNIVVMCGAGISVSAGIPDFRTPGSGLYSRLQQYKLPYPQAVFEIDFFRRSPRPFYLLAKELYPGTFAPTPTHHFIRLLHDRGLLLRCFTQNIDSLEHLAGVPQDKVIAAHGNFDTAHCIKCKAPHDPDHVKRAVFESDGNPAYCQKGKKACGGLVKPGIVFFGESLPERFWKAVPEDFAAADLLIVMGTSLVVQPFASLIDRVGEDTPRLLINREVVGEAAPEMIGSGFPRGFRFESPANYRDALHLGNCDDGVRELCRLLEWEGELDELLQRKGADPSRAEPSSEKGER